MSWKPLAGQDAESWDLPDSRRVTSPRDRLPYGGGNAWDGAAVGQGKDATWRPGAGAWDAGSARVLERSVGRGSPAASTIMCVVLFLACALIGRAYINDRIRSLGGEGVISQYETDGLDAPDAGRSKADGATDAPPADGSSRTEGETGSAGADVALAPTQSTGDGISPNWRDREFSIDGHKFALGSFSAGEFMDQTGWTIDETVTSVDRQIEPGQGQTSIYLRNPSYSDRGDVLLMVDVTNTTSAATGLQDCTVTSLAVAVAPHSDVSCPDFEIAGGIRLRGTSPERAKGAIPAKPVQDMTRAGNYKGYSYTQRNIEWYGGNAEYALALTFDEGTGELYGLSMAVRLH